MSQNNTKTILKNSYQVSNSVESDLLLVLPHELFVDLSVDDLPQDISSLITTSQENCKRSTDCTISFRRVGCCDTEVSNDLAQDTRFDDSLCVFWLSGVDEQDTGDI
ncbi:hypothetical protein WICPIJ_005485 [Wickerhamomyces pijperi]|uniref:Uncharacterized protein n=1 Tax=Wickerhamomyces pijperi TaxID=599730 RepID=A0A9P8TLW4_WICPI|nr:hypothetical protein WICPIJ_005485 [Wickerhamomyces pijperi]